MPAHPICPGNFVHVDGILMWVTSIVEDSIGRPCAMTYWFKDGLLCSSRVPLAQLQLI